MTWFQSLHDRVELEGQRPVVLRGESGRLLVAQHGARLLACELPGVDHNLFFHTHETKTGHVTGGDRLWIAPEVAYYWPSLDDALRDPKETAINPSEVDPGRYTGLQPWAGAWSMSNAFSVTDARTGRSAQCSVEREVALIDSLREMHEHGLVGFSFSVRHTLGLIDGDVGVTCGAWSILQVPPTGELVCPTVRSASVNSYYDPFGERHVVVEPGCVRFLIDGARRIKMGISAADTTGRMGYYRALDRGMATLIVRVFSPLPGEPYCDLPRDDVHHRQLVSGALEGAVLGGDALQAYNDDGDAFGGGPSVTFGEMEYHDPCVVVGRGPSVRSGGCVTHVVAGPVGAVRAWGKSVLGVEVGA